MYFMVDTGVTIRYILCGVMYLSAGMYADYDVPHGFPTTSGVSVPVNSSVTLVCPDRVKNEGVTWFKSSESTYVAFINNKNGKCYLNNDNYPSITRGYHECKGGNFSITFSRIRYKDGGKWSCSINGSRSNVVNILVKGTVSTNLTTTTLLTTTSTLIKSTTISVSTNTSESKGVSTMKPKRNMTVTQENINTKDNIPLIAGAVVGTVGLNIIVTLLIVLITKRKNFQKRAEHTGQHGGNDGLEDEMGRDQISDAGDAISSAISSVVSSQPPPQGTSSTEGEAMGQRASSRGDYGVLHAESQDYYENIPQTEANRNYYNFHPAIHDNVHVYTNGDDEPGTSPVYVNARQSHVLL